MCNAESDFQSRPIVKMRSAIAAAEKAGPGRKPRQPAPDQPLFFCAPPAAARRGGSRSGTEAESQSEAEADRARRRAARAEAKLGELVEAQRRARARRIRSKRPPLVCDSYASGTIAAAKPVRRVTLADRDGTGVGPSVRRFMRMPAQRPAAGDRWWPHAAVRSAGLWSSAVRLPRCKPGVGRVRESRRAAGGGRPSGRCAGSKPMAPGASRLALCGRSLLAQSDHLA